jgi:hypothetical protein
MEFVLRDVVEFPRERTGIERLPDWEYCLA